MENFIGRKQELKALGNTYRNLDAFILISGVRGSGKTSLVNEFAKDDSVLFFSAGEVSDKLNRKNFLDQLSAHFNERVNDKLDIPEWEDLFKTYANRMESKRKILVLDNLELLLQNNPDFIKTLSQAWDKYLKPNNVFVVGIIPNTSILTDLETHKNALMDRSNVRIKLKPLSFIELLKQFPKLGFKELVNFYAITGGFPSYLELFEDADTISKQLDIFNKDLLNPVSSYRNDPLSALEKDVWEPVYYMTILSYIAQGNHTIKELVEKSGYKKKDVEQYIDNLEKLGIIKPEGSVEQKRIKSKNARYYFSNPSLRLWYRYVLPNQTLVNTGKGDEIVKKIKNDYTDFILEPYRDVCISVFLASLKQKSLDFNADKIGRFYNKTIEIPFVAIDEKKGEIIFGDIDYSTKPYTLERFLKFIQSTENIKELRKYRNYKKSYALFSIVKPEDKLIEYILQGNNALAYTGTTLYKNKN